MLSAAETPPSSGRRLSEVTIVYMSTAGFAGVYRTLKQARSLAERGARIVFVGYEGLVPSVYGESGFEVVLVPVPKASQSRSRLRALRVALNLTVHKARNAYLSGRGAHTDLVRAVLGTKPDIVQCVELPGLEYAHRAARRLGAKLIYDSNELWSGFLRNPDLAMSPAQAEQLLNSEARLIGEADLVLTTSDELSQRLTNDYAIRPPLTLLNSPPQIVREPHSVSEPIRLVYHGGLSADRNLDGLIRAMKQLEGRAVLDIHGFDRTVGAAALSELVSELGLESAVRVCGAYRYDEVVTLLSGYDVGVMTPKLIEENFLFTLPNKLFDCICAGVAVAMYDSPPMRRIIGEAKCGITIDPSTPETIARDLGALVDDPECIARMKRAAVEAAPRYWWPEQGRKLVEAVAGILRGER